MSTLRVNNITDTSGGSTNLTVPNTAKAWVNFNGTGTVAIRASYNVSSITDNGTGDYTVNFTNALADANYCVCGSDNRTTNASNNDGVMSLYDLSASSVKVLTRGSTGSALDMALIFVSIFR